MHKTVQDTGIAQKIKKLLTLADGNKNEHERSAAMKLAMELLSKHNLDLSSVSELAGAHEVKELRASLKLDPWVRYVIHAACKLYYTDFFMRAEFKGYFADRKEYHPTFVGTEENIAVTMEVASWLLDSIRCESNALFADSYQRRSFRLGAAHKVYDRACELVQEESQSVFQAGSDSRASNNSLMVLRNDLERANKRYLADKKLGTFKARSTYSDSSAYDMGSIFGESVNLGEKKKEIRVITMRD